MELSVYKFADLQRFRALLMSLKAHGVETVDEAIATFNGVVTEQHAAITHPSGNTDAAGAVEICPSCGKGIVSLWPKISSQVGERVYGCKRCQWSEIR